MLEFSRGSPWGITQNVFVERGGAPAQFLVERATLAWPGGPPRPERAVTLVLSPRPATHRAPREVAGRTDRGNRGSAPARARAARRRPRNLRPDVRAVPAARGRGGARRDPGRARAVRRHGGSPRGALAAGLVYVHPIAPLYAVPAFACGLAVRDDSLRSGIREARYGLVAATIVALPYLYALAVLQSRYAVGRGGPAVDDSRTNRRRGSLPCPLTVGNARPRGSSACSLSAASSVSPASVPEYPSCSRHGC